MMSMILVHRCIAITSYYGLCTHGLEITYFDEGTQSDKVENIDFEPPKFNFQTNYNFVNSDNFKYEADAVHEAIKQGKIVCPEWDKEKCLRNLGLIDNFYTKLTGKIRE